MENDVKTRTKPRFDVAIPLSPKVLYKQCYSSSVIILIIKRNLRWKSIEHNHFFRT